MIAHVYVPLWLGIGVPWVAVCLLPWKRRRDTKIVSLNHWRAVTEGDSTRDGNPGQRSRASGLDDCRESVPGHASLSVTPRRRVGRHDGRDNG